jgi:hypothetical protein
MGTCVATPERVKTSLVVPLLLFSAAPAVADEPDTVDEPDTLREPDAAQVADDPVPGMESGRIDQPEGDSPGRDVAQALMTPPRVAVEVVLAPVRATVWAFDHYQLIPLYKRIFFDDTETYGLYPTLNLDSTYGVTVGARFVHRDLFGEDEHLSMRAGLGGQFKALASILFTTGNRLGERTELGLGTALEHRPNDRFYGIGNATSSDMKSYFEQQVLRPVSTLDVRLVDSLFATASGYFNDLHFSGSDSTPTIQSEFDVMDLTGWPRVRNFYGELELRWDSRARPSYLDQHAMYDSGWLASLYGGRMFQLDLPDDYWQYGAYLQNFLPLGLGPRVLVTRLQLNGVTGGYDDVAFTQLPQLGGNMLLRGYPFERFRDRVAALGSVEYQWDLGRLLMAGLFIDVGRVYSGLDDLSLNDLRMGYGLSLQLHSKRSFLAALTLASSIDGGIFFDLTFDPIFYIEPRVEQR